MKFHFILPQALAAAAAISTAPAHAADTAVTCNAPEIQVITGKEQALASVTIVCTGGSSAGNITYFSYEDKLNTTVAQMIATVASNHILESGDGPLTIYSNLSDLSGTAWGCGGANCRVIDQLEGF